MPSMLYLLKINDKTPKLDKFKIEIFYEIIGKALYISKIDKKYILIIINFLFKS